MSLSRRQRDHNRSAPSDSINTGSSLLGLYGRLDSAHHHEVLLTDTVATGASDQHSLLSFASHVAPPAQRALPSQVIHASSGPTRRHEPSIDSRDSEGRGTCDSLGISTLPNNVFGDDTIETSVPFTSGPQRRDVSFDAEIDLCRDDLSETRGLNAQGSNFHGLLGPNYLEGSGSLHTIGLRDPVAALTPIKRRGKEYSLHARAAYGGSTPTPIPTPEIEIAPTSDLLQKLSILNQPSNVSAPPLQSADAVDKHVAGATITPQASESAAGYSGAAVFTGRIHSAHRKYSLSENTETDLKFPRQVPAFDGSTKLSPVRSRHCCHICRRINEEVERCSSCGHRLCIDCGFLGLVTPVDSARQEFAIFEDGDGVRESQMRFDDQKHARNVYTPSEFEQENFVDRSASMQETPCRQTSIAKVHYTTPQSLTVDSPIASPLDVSHISASDYPAPLRLTVSPAKTPAPRKHRIVKDNPFIIADQLSSRSRRVHCSERGAELTSRDGQSSPISGQPLSSNPSTKGQKYESIVERCEWQPYGTTPPEPETEHHTAFLNLCGTPTGNKADFHFSTPNKSPDTHPVTSRPLTPLQVRKRVKSVPVGSHAHPSPKAQRNREDCCEDGPKGDSFPSLGLHARCEPWHSSNALQHTSTCLQRSARLDSPLNCDLCSPDQIRHTQKLYKLAAEHTQPLHLAPNHSHECLIGYSAPLCYPFHHNRLTHCHPVSQIAECTDCYGQPLNKKSHIIEGANSHETTGELTVCQHCQDLYTNNSCHFMAQGLHCCRKWSQSAAAHNHPYPCCLTISNRQFSKREREVSRTPKVVSPIPRKVVVSPKWMVPSTKEDVPYEKMTGLGMANLGNETVMMILQRDTTAGSVAVIGAISPFAFATGGNITGCGMNQVMVVRSERHAESASREQLVEDLEARGNGLHGAGRRGQGARNALSVQLEHQIERERRGTAPSPEPVISERKSNGTSDAAYREQISEMIADARNSAMQRAAVDMLRVDQECNTPTVGETGGKRTLEGAEKVDGISIVVHLVR